MPVALLAESCRETRSGREPIPENCMVGVLILTHGRMAEELLAAARKISGELPNFGALALDWSDDLESAQGKVSAALEQLNQGAGVLILTDIFGGTPSNLALKFFEPDEIEVVSGVNLPMVVRLGCLRGQMPIGEMSEWISAKGRDSILCGKNVPRPPRHRDCDT